MATAMFNYREKMQKWLDAASIKSKVILDSAVG
jgi:hypothetical protein